MIPDISGLASETELTAVEGKIPDVAGFVKQRDYSNEITKIKNDCATNASLDSKLNELKAQHIADEVKKVDDKVKKNASDILGFESRLKQKEDIADEGKRENSFNREFYHYLQKSYLVYKCRTNSFKKNASSKLTTWKSTGIDNLSANSDLKAISDGARLLPTLENYGRMSVKFNGNYFVQNKVLHPNNNNVVNIYIVYKLDTINNARNTDYSIQNALFGAVKITKNDDISKNKYEGYGICFDEGVTFTKGNITNGKNVIIFGADMSFSIHANNRAHNIYVLGDFLIQGINGTSIYAERFKAKNDQILKERPCVGNLSSNWTVVNSTKTGLFMKCL